MNGKAELLMGDCMAVLPTLPAGHYHCVVTSPPYFALRSYLPAGHPDKALEIGSEPTPEAFVATMVAVFREVRRVLHPSGLLFLNLGDSYAGSGKGGGGSFALDGMTHAAGTRKTAGDGQLLNMPHRVAEALSADGWVWRQTIVWAKPSPMPESCAGWRWMRCRVKMEGTNDKRDRIAAPDGERPHITNHSGSVTEKAKWAPCPGCPKCIPSGGWVLRRGRGRCTSSHEYVFVMAKSRDYFWDAGAAVEKATNKPPGNKLPGKYQDYNRNDALSRRQAGKMNGALSGAVAHRNYRSVWKISAEPSSEKHFAAYPSELVRKCLSAGASSGGCCPHCGAPWAAMVENEQLKRERPHDRTTTHAQGGGVNCCGNTVAGVSHRVLGYRPTCECGRPCPAPCRVLDPFAGTGTTLQTAVWLGHDATGIELNPAYVEIAQRRLLQPPRWWLKQHRPKAKRINITVTAQLHLFN